MKKLLLLSAISFGAANLNAQEIYVIPKVGVNLSKQSLSGPFDGKNRFGFQGGVAVDIHPGTSGFSIQPELNFVNRGSKLKSNGVETKYSMNYLEVPLLAKYSFGPVYVNAGPSIGFQLGGKDKFNSLYGSNPKRFDFGIQMGAGVAIPAGKGKVIVDGRYALGLTDLHKGNQSVKNRGIMASVGYAFPLGK